MTERALPIGVFDSGVGGLSVWRELVRCLPHESTIYIADQAHVPYGPRPAAQVRRFAEGITRLLLTFGCKAIVVACNAASAAALHHLRELFPETSFIGMEPAVKPAARQSVSNVVGVLATTGTFQGQLFAQTAGRFAANVRLINQACPGLVERIERGDCDTVETEQRLRSWLEPMLAQGADTLVLACTHYPFVLPAIQRIISGRMHVIDPAPAVARQLQQVLGQRALLAAPDRAEHRFYTSAAPATLNAALKRLLDIEAASKPLVWKPEQELAAPA